MEVFAQLACSHLVLEPLGPLELNSSSDRFQLICFTNETLPRHYFQTLNSSLLEWEVLFIF